MYDSAAGARFPSQGSIPLQELDSASLHLARVHSHDSLRHIRVFVHASMTKILLYLRLPCSLLPEHYTTNFSFLSWVYGKMVGNPRFLSLCASCLPLFPYCFRLLSRIVFALFPVSIPPFSPNRFRLLLWIFLFISEFFSFSPWMF